MARDESTLSASHLGTERPGPTGPGLLGPDIITYNTLLKGGRTMANQIIDVILEFLRISFTTWPNVFIISTGPLIIVVGGLTLVWMTYISIYVGILALVQWRKGKPVGWSRPKTQSELLLAAGSPDIWQKSLVPPDPDRLRGCGDFFLHTRDDGTYDCRHCGVSARVHN